MKVNPVIKRNVWLKYLLDYLSNKVSWSVISVIFAFYETILIRILLKVSMAFLTALICAPMYLVH